MRVTADKGTLLIVGDPELQDRYIAELMKLEHLSLTERNPIVKILFVLRYPVQHAILWPDHTRENRAIDKGIICRLHFYGFPDKDLIACFSSYEDSLKASQEEALLRARQKGDDNTAEIIARHIRGEFAPTKRALIIYKRWEL